MNGREDAVTVSRENGACGAHVRSTVTCANFLRNDQSKPTAVIVSSSVTKNGSVLSGNNRKLVIVRIDPGYGPSPGGTGTGTVYSVVCQ